MIGTAGVTRRSIIGEVSLARNVLLNWMAMGFTIVVTFYVTPIVVRALQNELYGVWSFLNGLLVYSDLLYAGLGSALIKYVAANKAQDDQGGLNRVASAVLSIYLVLGLLCFGGLAALSPLVPRFFAHPLLTPQADVSASYACILLGVQLLATFVGSAVSGVLFGLDRVDLISLVRIAALLCRTVAIVTLINGDSPLLRLASITAAAAVLETVGLACLAFVVDRRLKLRLAVPTRPEFRSLYGFGLQSFVVIFSLTVINYTDTTVIGVTLGAASVALYSLPLQLVEYVRVAASGSSGVLFPRLTVLATRGDIPAMQVIYLRSARATMFLASLLTANMLFLAAPFLSLWVGPEFGEHVQWVVVCLSLATLLHIFTITVPMGFYQAMGTLRVPAVVLLLEGLANLGLSVWLAPRLGIVGVAIGTAVPAAVMGCLILPPYLGKALSIPTREVYRGLIPSAVLLLATVAIQGALGLVIDNSSYLLLGARALLTVPPAILIFAWVFPSEDRHWLEGGIRETLHLPSAPTSTAE